MKREQLESQVFDAFGQVSVCWDKQPKGIFDAEKAAEIGIELMIAIDHYLSTQKVSDGWVRVDQHGLPKRNSDGMSDWVLTFSEAGYRNKQCFDYELNNWNGTEWSKVTHWMPLPEPPKDPTIG